MGRIGAKTKRGGIALLAAFWVLGGAAWADDGPPALPESGPPELPPAVDAPPPLPPLSYYLGVRGEKVGPLDRAALAERVVAGDLDADTLVWTKGMDGWEKASTREDLASVIQVGAAAEETAEASESEEAGETEERADTGGGFDPQNFLLGSWDVSGSEQIEGMGKARFEGEETFAADGSYRMSGTMFIDNPPAELAQILQGPLKIALSGTGTYRVVGADGRTFKVSADVTVTMKDEHGLGLSEQEKSSETINLVAVDDDTYRERDSGLVAKRR